VQKSTALQYVDNQRVLLANDRQIFSRKIGRFKNYAIQTTANGLGQAKPLRRMKLSMAMK
jgi:hypothetical protein